MFSLKPVALPASLCCCPIPSLSAPVFCSSWIPTGCLIQHALPATCLYTKARWPSLPLSCCSLPVPGQQDQHLQGHSKKPPQPCMKGHILREFSKSWQASAEYMEDDVFQPCRQAKCRPSHDSRLASCQIFSLCFKTLGILNEMVVRNYIAQCISPYLNQYSWIIFIYIKLEIYAEEYANWSCQPVCWKSTTQLNPSSHKGNYLGTASTRKFYRFAYKYFVLGSRIGMSVTHNLTYALQVTERIHVLSKLILRF